MKKIVSKLDKEPKVEDLITLYESDGVTPEYPKRNESDIRNSINILCKTF